MDWKSAIAGSFGLTVNGVSKQVVNYINNSSLVIDSIRLGAMGVDAGTSGKVYFDDYESHRYTAVGLANPPTWTNKSYTYGDASHKHAVTSVNVTDKDNNISTNSYTYDANGNMTCRVEGGKTYIQNYNAENRLSGLSLVSGDCANNGVAQKTWAYIYDGDGTKVKQQYYELTVLKLTTYYFAGGSYELQTDGTTETTKQYYSIAGMTVVPLRGIFDRALRRGMVLLPDGPPGFGHWGHRFNRVARIRGTVYPIANFAPPSEASGVGELRDLGTNVNKVTQTDFGYTFQRNLPDTGLMDYKARAYDPTLGRFIQPDTIIPGAGNPQAFNRYGYVKNNPINLNDPSGQRETGPCGAYGEDCHKKHIIISGGGSSGSGGSGGSGGDGNNANNGNNDNSSSNEGSDPVQIQCGGVINFLEGATCSNVNQALSIVQNRNASRSQRFWSGYYVAVVANVHVGLIVGLSMVAWELIVGSGTTCATNPECSQKHMKLQIIHYSE